MLNPILRGHIQYREGMSSTQLQFLNAYGEYELNNMMKMEGSRRTATDFMISLMGSFAGTFADPVNAAAIFFPALRAETYLFRGSKLLVQNPFSGGFFGSVKRGAQVGAVEAAVREPFILGAQNYTQGQYTAIDSMFNLVAAPLFGAGLGGTFNIGNRWLAGEFHKAVDSTMDGTTVLSADPKVRERALHLRVISRIEEELRKRIGTTTQKGDPMQTRTSNKLRDPEAENEVVGTRKTRPAPLIRSATEEAEIRKAKPAKVVTEEDVDKWILENGERVRVVDETGNTRILPLNKPMSEWTQSDWAGAAGAGKPTPKQRAWVSQKRKLWMEEGREKMRDKGIAILRERNKREPTKKEVDKWLKEEAVMEITAGGKKRIIPFNKPLKQWTPQDWENAVGPGKPDKASMEFINSEISAFRHRARTILEEAQARAEDFERAVQGSSEQRTFIIDELLRLEKEAVGRLVGKTDTAESTISWDSIKTQNQAIRTQYAIAAKALAQNPEARAELRFLQKERAKILDSMSTKASNPTEYAVSQIFSSTFGRKVRFYKEGHSAFFGGQGYVASGNYKAIYLMKGAGFRRLLYVGGHELSHSLKYQNPEAYFRLVQLVSEWDELTKGDLVDSAMRQVYTDQGNLLTRNYTMDHMLEEAYGNVLGQALQDVKFWQHLSKESADLFSKLYLKLAELHTRVANFVRWHKPYSQQQEFEVVEGLNEDLGKLFKELDLLHMPETPARILTVDENVEVVRKAFFGVTGKDRARKHYSSFVKVMERELDILEQEDAIEFRGHWERIDYGNSTEKTKWEKGKAEEWEKGKMNLGTSVKKLKLDGPISYALAIAQRALKLTDNEAFELARLRKNLTGTRTKLIQARSERKKWAGLEDAAHKDLNGITEAHPDFRRYQSLWMEARKNLYDLKELVKILEHKYQVYHKQGMQYPVIWRTDPLDKDKWEIYVLRQDVGEHIEDWDAYKSIWRTKNKEFEDKVRGLTTFDGGEERIDPGMYLFRSQEMEPLPIDFGEGRHDVTLPEEMAARWIDDEINHLVIEAKTRSSEEGIEGLKAHIFEKYGKTLHDTEALRILEKDEFRNFLYPQDEILETMLKVANFIAHVKKRYGMDITPEEGTRILQDATVYRMLREAGEGDHDDLRLTAYGGSDSYQFDYNAISNNIGRFSAGFENPVPMLHDPLGNFSLKETFEQKYYEALDNTPYQEGDRLFDEIMAFRDRMGDNMLINERLKKLEQGINNPGGKNWMQQTWDRMSLRLSDEKLNLERIKQRVQSEAQQFDSGVNRSGAYVKHTRETLSERLKNDEAKVLEIALKDETNLADIQLLIHGRAATLGKQAQAPKHPDVSSNMEALIRQIVSLKEERIAFNKHLVEFAEYLQIEGIRNKPEAAILSAMREMKTWSILPDWKKRQDFEEFKQIFSLYERAVASIDGKVSVQGFRSFLKLETRRRLHFDVGSRLKEMEVRSYWTQRNREFKGSFMKGAKSYFDGVYRKGLDAKKTPYSIESRKAAASTMDSALVRETVIKHGISQQLEDPDSGLFKLILDYHDFKDNALLPADPRLRQAVIDMAEAMDLTNKSQIYGFVSNFVDVRYRPGFWASQKHNRTAIMKDKQGWLSYMRSAIDWEETRSRTNRPWDQRNKEGDDAYLEAVYSDIVNNRLRHTDAEDGEFVRNLSNELIQKRQIIFKKGHSHDYDLNYGSGDPWKAYLQGLQRRSELRTLFEEFGPNPERTFNNILRDNNMSPGDRGVPGLRKLFDYVTGKMDDPIDRKWAEWRSTIMQYTNAVYLGQSTITATNDIAHMISSMRYLGINMGEENIRFMNTLKTAIGRQGKNAQAIQYFRYLGAGADVVINSASRRYLGEIPMLGLSGRMNNTMFKANFLNWWTAAAQETMVDVLTRVMGEADFVQRHPFMMEVLNGRYGITPEDFASVHEKYRTKVDSVDEVVRLSPDMFELDNPKLARKMRNFLEDWIRQGVLEPDATSQVWTRMGLRDGEPAGALVRIATQYLSFGLATYRKTYMRMLNGYGEQGFMAIFQNPNKRQIADIASFVGWSLALGYLSLNIKELLKGREPIYWANMNPTNARRLLYQSGTPGPLGELIFADSAEDIGKFLAGPSIGMAFDLGEEVLEMDVDGFIFDAERSLPFATLPYPTPATGEMRKRFTGVISGEAYMNSQRAVENLLEQNVFFFNPESDDQ